MNYKTFLLSGLTLLLGIGRSMAQAGDFVLKFGNVPAETFASPVYAADSTADAVVLFDKGTVNFEAASGSGDGFDVIFERHYRVRLLNKNALRLATLQLPFYKKGNKVPSFDNFKGATYNFEDGKVVTTKVEKSNIFKDQNGDVSLVRVAFPNAKEGSVIEYTYRVIYPGFGFVPGWYFQGEYPVLWSEYEITIPSLLTYIIQKHGYLQYSIDNSTSTPGNFNLTMGSYRTTWKGNAIHRLWAMQHVPAMIKREPYTTALSNHISKIEFQLASIKMQGFEKTFRNNWDQLTEELLRKETFGAALTDRNSWIDDELPKITAAGNTSLKAAQDIYYYVRDHFSSTNVESMYLSQSLKKTWEEKKGNTGDINLLLTALYTHQGFEAAPVILSTRAHGFAYEAYPLLKDYNYVITRVKVGDNYYLLDASKDIVGFGQLPELCYNGSGRIIDASHNLVILLSDSVTEKKNTIVSLANTDTAGYSGSFSHTAGTFGSMEIRNRLKRMKLEDFFEVVHKTMPTNKTMKEHGIDSLDKPGALVTWHYNMKYNFQKDQVYFNPILHERLSNNPFTSPERHYPVEMPYCPDFSYSLTMDVPKGYQIDELPKQERILLDDGSNGFFEYNIKAEGARILFSYHFVLKKTGFTIDEYPALRDFYTRVVKKQQEEIVFKKIKQ